MHDIFIKAATYDQEGILRSVTAVDKNGMAQSLSRLQLQTTLLNFPGSVSCDGKLTPHAVLLHQGFIVRHIDANEPAKRDYLGDLPETY